MTSRRLSFGAPSANFAFLVLLVTALWFAGGASRADVLGQAVVRGAAVAALIGALLCGAPPTWREGRAVAMFMAAAIVLVLAQLIPLPPSLWQTLPGRAPLSEAAVLAGEAQPWRPLAIVPDLAINAAASLLVPLAMLVLILGLDARGRSHLPTVLLALIAASAVLGILQIGGAKMSNPLINRDVGSVAGIFANRNHFALFLAMGCALAPCWMFQGGRSGGLRVPIGLGLMLLFILVVLATGSRTGLMLLLLALLGGLGIIWREVRRALRHAPRWVYPAILLGSAGVVAIFVVASVGAGRAISLDRVVALDPAEDLRLRFLPIVIETTKAFFPVGAGAGSFDAAFRLYEPVSALKPSYFNHAHNDFAEVALEGGLVEIALLATALFWWAFATVRAWREPQAMLRKLGSVILLLVLVAALFDYAARTPMIMATIITAALWLELPPQAEAVHDERSRGQKSHRGSRSIMARLLGSRR